MNEDNKPDNSGRETRSHALLKGTPLKGGVEGNQSKEDLGWSLIRLIGVPELILICNNEDPY